MSKDFIKRRKNKGNSGSQKRITTGSGSGSGGLIQGSKGLSIGGGASRQSVSSPSKTGSVTSLTDQMQQAQKRAQKRAAFKQKPFLVYLIVDLTGSRADTRATMRDHEESLARLIQSAGGEHPVICKGVYHSGGGCSQPQILNSSDDILSFLGKRPEGGATRIEDALSHYFTDSVESVLSLGVVIGDAADGDSANRLYEMADRLKQKHRPILVAHQELDHGVSELFCQDIGPEMARRSGGFDFSLGEQPDELLALLENYKQILTATPDSLNAVVQGRGHGGLTLSGTSSNQSFIADQAQLLLEHRNG